MNKKILAVILAALLIVSCVALVACEKKVASVTIKEGTLSDSAVYKHAYDYSNLVLVVTYDDNSTEEISVVVDGKLFDGVEVKNISTTKTGTQIFRATYKGITVEKTVNVEIADNIEDYDISTFRNTDAYYTYQTNKGEQSLKESQFVSGDAPYMVGANNGYHCVPVATVTNGDETITNENIKTTYKLYVKGQSVALEGEALTKVLSKVENNIYYFTNDAIGNEYKLEIYPDDSYYTVDEIAPVVQEFKVIDAYNVHDVLDLSVLDNYNNKGWASIKETVRPWNNGKKLSEFTDINNVVLHSNINVTKNDLPSSYFWNENDEGIGSEGISYAAALDRTPAIYKNILKGSLKETCTGEDWERGGHMHQRGLYVSNGIGIQGNYLKVSYTPGFAKNEDGSVTADNGGIYVVSDFNMSSGTTSIYPECHWSFVSYQDSGDTSMTIKNPTVQNVYFVGQNQKSDNTGIPAGLMTFASQLKHTLTVDNVIANQWYNNFVIETNVICNLQNSKFYDSFSQMVYGYFATELNITNCELKRAGGPILIMQSKTADDDWAKDRPATNINVDSLSNIESWVTGSEIWFTVNNLPSGTMSQLFSLTGVLNGLGKNYIKQDGNYIKYNLVAVIIPAPSEVFTNQKTLYGNLNVGTGENVSKQGMDEDVFNALISLSETCTTGATLCSGLKAALGENAPASLDQLIAGFTQLASGTASLKIAPVFKSGSDYAIYTGEPTPLNPFGSSIGTNVKALYDGLTQVVALLTSQGQDTTQFVAVQAKLAPLAKEVSDTDWFANWQNNTQGYASLYINAGGLDSGNPDMNKKHFVVVFGEDFSAKTTD